MLSPQELCLALPLEAKDFFTFCIVYSQLLQVTSSLDLLVWLKNFFSYKPTYRE